MRAGKVAVFGVPSAAGARSAGTSQAPLALRQAGLLEALRAAGARVVHLSDLSLFPFREDPAHPRARNAEVAACAARTAGDEMIRALAEGFALVLGGDCSLVVGTLGGARQALGENVGVVYLDADADLNTPETTPSGYLDGMALAHALGRGVPEVASAAGPPPALQPEHAALVGYRALDDAERSAISELGLALPAAAARKLGMRATADLALDGVGNGDGPVIVHMDVDVLDPSAMPAKDVVAPGEGLAWEEATDLLARLLASPRVVALEVAEFNPAKDANGAAARGLVDLLARAIARRLRA